MSSGPIAHPIRIDTTNRQGHDREDDHRSENVDSSDCVLLRACVRVDARGWSHEFICSLAEVQVQHGDAAVEVGTALGGRRHNGVAETHVLVQTGFAVHAHAQSSGRSELRHESYELEGGVVPYSWLSQQKIFF